MTSCVSCSTGPSWKCPSLEKSQTFMPYADTQMSLEKGSYSSVNYYSCVSTPGQLAAWRGQERRRLV